MMTPRRVLLALCAVSLLANVFMVGFFLVPKLLGPEDRVARLGAIAAIGRAPKPMMDLIETKLHDDRDEIRAAFREVWGARRDVRSAMRAEPFDAGGLDAAFAQLRTKSILLQEEVHQAVARAVAEAPVELRSEIGSRWDRPEKKGDPEKPDRPD
ncbi:periplasmic heavy metal sensor [Terrihabitans sp. B22-R8]|uniref:periplasmic heavy metal sensor n=1 Tax=Terrihabitans sp. B22-R8 TaxID=3425128 RepID=UPI00403C15E0